MNRWNLATLAVLSCSAAFGAQAQDSPAPRQARFELFGGAFLPAFNSDVRVNEPGDLGSDIDLEDDLGVQQDETGFWVGFEWRIAERHRLGATYSRFTLDGRREIDEVIEFEDEEYPIGATILTETKLEIIPITYSYSVLKREKDELAITAGIHFSGVTLSLDGSTSLDDSDISATAEAKADLPLPLFGIRYDHHFSEKWSVGASAAFFTIEFGEDELDAKGSLLGARVFGEYHFNERFGAGIALDSFKLNLEVGKADWDGEYDYQYWGPQVYLTARF